MKSDQKHATLAVMPQDTRIMALLLGAVGGCLDVFSHKIFGTLIATQTGNIILLVADWGEHAPTKTWASILSLLFFTLGFLGGILLTERKKTTYWRVAGVLPLLVTSFLYPFFADHALFWIALLSMSTGVMMRTFTGTKIEEHSYVIMMTSGNYRKMVGAWFDVLRKRGEVDSIKRQAINYSIVVFSFIAGAILTGILTKLVGPYALWIVTGILSAICVIYVTLTKAYHLEEVNL